MRRALLALLLVPSPLAAAQAPPHGAVRLAPDSEARWIPFELTPGNQIRFQMSVNGRPASAILDTGVSYSVASSAFAARIGLRAATPGQAQAIGGNVPLAWAEIESIGLGGLSRNGGRIAVAELRAIATGSATPVDLLVGADLLAAQALDIDYDGQRFRLLRSGRLPFTGTSAPLSVSPDTGIYVSEVTIGTRRLRPVIVDTGDGSALTLSRAAWRGVALPRLRVTSSFAVGLGGEIETDLTVLPAIRIGPMPARNVELHVERGAGGFSGQTNTVGRIGSGLLQRYRVLLDPTARRMVLARGRTADAMPVKSTSGLLLGFDNDALRVLHVMAGSPAAASGWKAGDRICRVDGTVVSLAYATSAQAAWTVGVPGRTVRLDLCDGGGTRALTLATFY